MISVLIIHNIVNCVLSVDSSQARVTSLEKQNQELQWQIAMINHDPEIGQAPAPGRTIQAPKNLPGEYL